jgi:uncharacterized membrane protein
MDRVQLVVTILALLGAGVIGGVFFAFSSFVMRALGRLPSAHGISAMQAINVTVINPRFLGVFLGTAALSLGSIALAGLRWTRPGSGFGALGGALYFVGTFLVTMRGNVPLNESLAEVEPSDGDAADEWRSYLVRWTTWNHVRTAAALVASVCFCLALLAAASAR